MSKQQIAGSPILPGQTHEAYIKIEKTLKSLNINPHEGMKDLLRNGFFETGVKDYFTKGLESFIVGDVFRHRDETCVPQYHGSNAKDWIFTPNAKVKIAIKQKLPKLSEYILPKDMNDSDIQSNAKSTPMDEETFLLVLYLLIIKPELGKKILGYELRKDRWYLFHVKLSSGKVVAVNAFW